MQEWRRTVNKEETKTTLLLSSIPAGIKGVERMTEKVNNACINVCC